MYTQCNHCKAIFRVTMKELTAAQGLLRCGECDAIFDAMKSLSTTLPEERRFAQQAQEKEPAESTPVKTERSAGKIRLPRKHSTKTGWWPFRKKRPTRQTANRPTYKRSSSSRNFLILGITALLLLLLLQLLYSNRNWLAQQPWGSAFTRQACAVLGCELQTPRDVSKIKLLSRNVYSHPNTPGVLTISAAIQNDATFRQPYPLVEVSFLDKENKIVALRRFMPEEYIQGFDGALMQVGEPDELILNIADPGEEAVRFQFRFL